MLVEAEPQEAQTGTLAPNQCRMGQRTMELGTTLGQLRSANELLDDVAAMKARLEEDGYLFIKGLQPRAKVQDARRVILENLASNGQIDTSKPLDEGWMTPNARGAFKGGQKETTRHPKFLDLVESPEIMGFFEKFFGKSALTYDFKWLRAIGTGEGTGAHYDVVYMGRGTKRNLFTCWTPLGDVSLRDGPLAILVGSHNLPGFKKIQETYGKMDVDRDHVTGWFSDDPLDLTSKFGGQWCTSDFQMGDVIIFGMYTMHGSVKNETRRFRISCDTRYQPQGEAVDERWIGEKPIGHYAWTNGPTVPMDEMRKEWGV